LAVDLVEADFFGIRRRRIEGNRAGHERKAQKAFPVGTGGHGILRKTQHTKDQGYHWKTGFQATGAGNLSTPLTVVGGGAGPWVRCRTLPATRPVIAGRQNPEHHLGSYVVFDTWRRKAFATFGNRGHHGNET